MKAIVIGSGRMGIRHISGLLKLNFINEIHVVDINQNSLNVAREQLNDKRNICFFSTNIDFNNKYDLGIISTTAKNRIILIENLFTVGCKNILIEKPLGQSKNEVNKLLEKLNQINVNCFVNLNMRLHECYIDLKNDFENLDQLHGEKIISLNTGSVGIGANGIHYLDFIFFLTQSDNAVLRYGHISKNIILSGRGSEFCDFGGNAIIDYYKKNKLMATFIISINPNSSAFGNWNIVGKHAHININELESLRINRYRKIDSNLPTHRYNGDYLEAKKYNIEFPPLGDLTAVWATGIYEGKSLLPTVQESIKVHDLMFEWLNFSESHNDYFPIT